MLLLGVLIVASIAGTIYESSFDAKVARAYIYGAPWFNLWLLLLGLNLIASAFSRRPWKRHHTGFLITHLGIILVLLGSFIGHVWGIEGTMVLFKGEPASNQLTLDQRVLQITASEDSVKVVPFEFINHYPTPDHPRHLATTASGWDFQAIDYSSSLEVKSAAQPVASGGSPAVHLTLSTAMMGQKLDTWLLADEGHDTFDLGLASISFKKGGAPELAHVSASTPAVDIEESIFAFANSPADQVARAIQGGGTGAKVKLIDTSAEDAAKVIVQLPGVEQSFQVKALLGHSMEIANSPYTLSVEQYWPDFRIQDGKPMSLSAEPNNPCVLVTLRGHAVPASQAAAPGNGKNYAILYTDEKQGLSYQLSSRKAGLSSGKLVVGEPLVTGWADWQLLIDQALPSATQFYVAKPAPNGKTEGVLVRATHGNDQIEKWIPLGWQISVPTSPRPMLVGYGLKQYPISISLKLLDFVVERNEGTEAPAGFKSTVQITNIDGTSVTGQCWMNNPISFPDSWLNVFSGLTYKVSQASWNPENLRQSSVQILRDPGWGLKWIGSLLVVAGIFNLFYLRPYPHDLKPAGENNLLSGQNSPPAPQPAEASL